MFDLDPNLTSINLRKKEGIHSTYQKKVNFANNDVFQMILGFVVFKLYMETFLYSDLETLMLIL